MSRKKKFDGITTSGGVNCHMDARNTQPCQSYTLNCDKCGIPFDSPEGYPSPQLCEKCKPDTKSKEAELAEMGDSRYEWRTCPKCDGKGKITYGELLYG